MTGVVAFISGDNLSTYGNDHLRLCYKNQAWTEGVRDVALPQTSSRLEVEPFTDDCEGLRERSGTDAESALAG